jgi:acetylornithine deacetylase/succinyl-diaminopimelate desuccinylase-like protein
MGYLVDRHPDLIRAEWALSEGAGTTMYIGGKPVYDIRTAEKGTYRFKLRAHGPPGHGSKPVPGTAVDRVARAVVALSSTPLPFRVTQTAARFFETITTLLDLPRPLRKLDEESLRRVVKVLPPDMGYYLSAITHDTAVPTGLRGGQKINVIPSEAEAWVDGRYLPGGTAERFLDEVRAVVGDGYEIEPVDITAPLESRTGGPLWDTIVSVMRRRAPDAAIVPVMLAGATDAKHVERLGTRCLGFGPLYVPPEFPAERLVHGHDERVPVEGYLWGLDTLLDIVVQFCR